MAPVCPLMIQLSLSRPWTCSPCWEGKICLKGTFWQAGYVFKQTGGQTGSQPGGQDSNHNIGISTWVYLDQWQSFGQFLTLPVGSDRLCTCHWKKSKSLNTLICISLRELGTQIYTSPHICRNDTVKKTHAKCIWVILPFRSGSLALPGEL